MKKLRLYAGATARKRLGEEGFSPDLFSLMLGASGGPKWLALARMDQVVFGHWLPQRREPIHAYGTSIGSWRHACFAQADSTAALRRMEKHYVEQRYSARPSPQEVSNECRRILTEVLGAEGAQAIVHNPRVITHVGTNRGRGLTAALSKGGQGVGLAAAALANAVGRTWLELFYQRVVFSSRGSFSATGMGLTDFSTETVPLNVSNLVDALTASGSIPLVLDGVTGVADAPPGVYWDGGIVDYHHDLRSFSGEGLVLYPHFFPEVIPGWFDKAFKGRRPAEADFDRVLLITPSQEFISTLPNGKIPDRKDFSRMETDERITTWRRTLSETDALAEELASVLERNEPEAALEPAPA